MPLYPSQVAPGSTNNVIYNNAGNYAATSQIQATSTGWSFSAVAPSAVSTGWSTSGGTPTKVLTNGTPTAANASNVVAALVTELLAKGIISA